MLEKIARWLTRKPKIVALVAVGLLIPSALGFIATRVNYDILSYLPEDLSSAQGERLLEEPFHMAATSMLVVEGMPAGYTNDLINAIKAVPGVSSAVWLSNLVGVQIPTEMIPASFRDIFFSGEATMIIIQYEKAGASDETMHAIDEIRGLCSERCFLAGFSVVMKDTKDLMDSELPVFVGLAVVLALLAMLLTLESTVLPFLFLCGIGIAILYNFGTNLLLGEISYITKAIAAVLQLGVSMDYSIFLYHRYKEEQSRFPDKRDAMAQAIVAAFTSLSGSSMTTIAGFLALCSMRLTLGRDIGLVMAKGVVLGVATVVLVLPALILIFDRQIEKHKHKSLMPNFDRANTFILRHRRLFFVLFLVLFLPALYAQNHVNIYYKLDESLPEDLPSIVANEKLKNDFDMASSHFIILRDDVPATDMNTLESAIKDVEGVTSVLSYHAMLGTGIPDFFIPDAVKEMLKQGGYQLMMVNSSCATASDEAAEQLRVLNALVTAVDPEALITGEAAMTNDLIETTNIDFSVANNLSVAAIFLIVAVVFRSLTVPLVLVAAIELAIFLNQGAAYFTGASVPFIAPTIISCVQLGATVDYAILMTTRFQEELRSGKDRMEAIRIAANSSDASIITSALVLFCATLGVSFVSSVDLIGAICVMLARGALISAVMSMTVMPSILCVCEPLFHKTSLHWRTAPPPKKHRRRDRKENALPEAEAVPPKAEAALPSPAESVPAEESHPAEEPAAALLPTEEIPASPSAEAPAEEPAIHGA